MINYQALAPKEVIERTVAAVESKKIEVVLVKNGDEALVKIKEFVPAGASVMNGSSVTLEQIGFVEYLKSGDHGWNNLHAAIVAEKDPVKQGILRKQAVLSDYYLGSVHALTQNGELVIASNTGSQLPHIVFTSPNLIFIVSTKKIVASLDVAMRRLGEHVIPLEDKNMTEKYGVGTASNKILIFKGENLMMGRKIRIILVEEDLGF